MWLFHCVVLVVFDKFLDGLIGVLQLIFYLVRSFFTRFFDLSRSGNFFSEKSLQKHPTGLRKTHTVNSVFNIYFNAENIDTFLCGICLKPIFGVWG